MARRLLSKLEKDARRRIGWITAKNAGKVVTKDIYWKVGFLNMFLDRCDELGQADPEDGLALALHAPNLSRLIGIGDRPGEYRNAIQKTSYEVLSLAVLGSLCRRAGQHDDAERNYAHAFDIAEKNKVVPAIHCELLRRYGFFRTCLGAADAITFLNHSVEIGESIGSTDSLAEALLTRGHWYANHEKWGDAARDCSKALAIADKRSAKGKRTIMAGIANLAFVVASGGVDFDEQTKALQRVREIRAQLPRMTHMKCQLLWMEGLINRSMFFWLPAMRALSRARKGMYQLREAGDYVLVSLDLAGGPGKPRSRWCLCSCGRSRKMRAAASINRSRF